MGVQLQTVLGNLKKSLGLQKSKSEQEQEQKEEELDLEEEKEEEEEEEDEEKEDEITPLIKGLIKQSNELLTLQKSMGMVLIQVAEQQELMAKSITNRRGVVSAFEARQANTSTQGAVRHKQFTPEAKASAAEIMKKALIAGSLSLEDCVKLEQQINQSIKDSSFQLDERYIRILAAATKE